MTKQEEGQRQAQAAEQVEAKAQEFYAMTVLAGLEKLTRDDLEVVLAAAHLDRLLSELSIRCPGPGQAQSRATCMAYLDHYFGSILDKIEKTGLRLRFKP